MSIPRTYLLLIVALAAAIGMALPPAALAAAGSPSAGVHVDPSSPVAKEYALPLATARGAPADTGSTGALFGHGITDQSERSGEAGGGAGQGGGSGQSGGDRQGGGEQPGGGAQDGGTGQSTGAGQDGGSAPETTSTPATATAPAASSTPATGAHAGRPNRRHRRQGATAGTAPASARTGIASGRRHRAGGADPGAAPAATQILHPGSGSGWLWMLIAAGAVLAAGSAGAFLLVRVYQRDPKPN